MKKIAVAALALVSLLLVAGIVFATLYWRRLAAPSIKPEALLPANTLVLVEAVDLKRSGLRWRDTELYKLWAEPEVQTFLEKSLAQAPWAGSMKTTGDDLMKLWPRQAFVAVTGLKGNTPTIVGGFSYQGDRAAGERLLAPQRQKMKDAHPAGRAELSTYGKAEVQTYTDGEFVFAEADYKGWHLAANDKETLQGVLDLLDGNKRYHGPTLAADEDYHRAIGGVPADPELRLFVRAGVFVDRLAETMASAGSTNGQSLDQLRKLRAIAASHKFEDGQFRDTLYTLAAEGKELEPARSILGRGALELTTKETVAFYAAQLGIEVANLPLSPISLPMFAPAFDGALKKEGVKMEELSKVFSPEFTFISQSPAAHDSASVLAIALRDVTKGKSLAEAMADPTLGEEAWHREESGGTITYTAPPSSGLIPISPVLTVADKYWLLSLDPASFAPFLQRPAGAERLDQLPAYTGAVAKVVPPTTTFGYLDLGALFTRLYDTARPMAAMALIASPQAGQYFDAGKMPATPIVARHLGSLVLSQGTVPGGVLTEVRGNLSLLQLAGAGVAAWGSTGFAKPPLPTNIFNLINPMGEESDSEDADDPAMDDADDEAAEGETMEPEAASPEATPSGNKPPGTPK